MPNTNPRWKKSERAIAAKLGGRRVPVNGRGNSPDVAHPLFSVECKDREHLPVWLRNAMQQAQAGATPGQLPIVVLHERSMRHDDDIVLITLADFVAWFGERASGEAEMHAKRGKDERGCRRFRREPNGDELGAPGANRVE